MFFLESKPGDNDAASVVEKVLKLCERHGLKQTRWNAVGHYVYTVERIYEAGDLQAASLLQLVLPRKLVYETERDKSGALVVPATRAKPSIKIAAAFGTHGTIVSTRFREALVNAGLRGLDFRGVLIRGRSIRATKEPFWELNSSITLPPMSCALLRHGNGSVVIDEPPYGFGEIHYRRSDLVKLGSFDLAFTSEKLGRDQPAMVISPRFYETCQATGAEIDVRPVRIDQN